MSVLNDFFSWLAGFIGRNWEFLDLLLVAVGLFIYVTASHSLHQRRHPSAAIAWVMGILLVPYLALPLYLAFGSRKLPAARRIAPARPADETLPIAQATVERAWRLGRALDLPEPASYARFALHADGAQALASLHRIIDGARSTLEISTFLFGRDALGEDIAERLKRRAAAGVRVRLLIDGIGIYLGGYPDLSGLRRAGVEVLRFIPLFGSPKRGRTNLRNHRKMVVADGHWLWCGGRNLSAEYFMGDARPLLRRRAPWIDLSFEVDGGIAVQARHQFEVDWAFAADLPEPHPLPAQPSPTAATPAPLAQLIDSGPDRPDDTLHTLLVSGAFTSRHRILAVTPYFVPDQSLLTALMLAARRGVAVDLVLPRQSNHRIADFARHRALRDLVAAGGRAWLHPRMVHAKAIVIDDDYALAGSANLDGRSLFLNYELMVAFYDPPAVGDFAAWTEARRQESRPYELRRPGVLRELAEGVLLWLAFQL